MHFTFICVPEKVSGQPSGIHIRILGGFWYDWLNGKYGVYEWANGNNDINNNGPYLYTSYGLENHSTLTQLDSRLVSILSHWGKH